MIRLVLLLAFCALLQPLISAETPSVASNSVSYSMESTTAVTGVSQKSQSSGTYEVSSELDSNAFVPVELSNFEVE
jgi:hypothetical protein